MARPNMKTNPAYSFLAYQLSITDHVISWLMDNHFGTDAQEPPESIVCEYLPREEGLVPTDDVLHFIEEMRDRKAKLEREMRKFSFVRRGTDDPTRPSYDHLRILKPARSTSEQGSSEAKPEAKKRSRRRSKKG